MSRHNNVSSTVANTNRVIKKASFNAYDMRYEEAWLNSLGAKGLILRKVSGALLGKKYHFDKTDKNEIRYSIIPKEIDEISDEERELFSAAGWNPACERGCAYFYTDNPDAEPIFSDEESYREYHRKVFKRTLFDSIINILLVFIWTFNLHNRISGTFGLESLADESTISQTTYLIATICMITGILTNVIYTLKRRHEYMSGRYSDPRAVLKRTKVINFSLLILIILLGISLALSFIPDKTKLKNTKALSYSGEHPARLKEVFPDEWEFAEKRIRDSKTMEIIPAENGHGRVGIQLKYDYYIQDTSNLFLNRGYAESLYTSGGTISPLDAAENEEPDKATQDFIDSITDTYDSDAPEYSSLYYEFRSEEKAIKMLKEEIENEVEPLVIEIGGEDSVSIYTDSKGKAIKGDDAMKAIQIDVQGVDYAGFIDERKLIPETNGRGFQCLYLRKGNKVVYASYSGEHDLLDKLTLFTNQF